MHPSAPSAGSSLAAWLDYLERLHPKAMDFGLDRIDAVRARLALVPAFPLITVGGTNGKGSTCALLESFLRCAGYRVGRYSSPHLLRYNERVSIDGREAGDADLVHAFERVEAARAEVSLTYFEFGTLAAMLLFQEVPVEVAVLEVGLGGRLDAVNVFDPDCAVLVSVGLDHMEYLGDSREAIGAEFPEHFPAPAKQPPATQTGASRNPNPSNRAKGFADMPAASQQVALDYEKRLGVPKETTAKSYWADQERVKR